jgi:hypothetical protein
LELTSYLDISQIIDFHTLLFNSCNEIKYENILLISITIIGIGIMLYYISSSWEVVPFITRTGIDLSTVGTAAPIRLRLPPIHESLQPKKPKTDKPIVMEPESNTIAPKPRENSLNEKG